jgi:DnaJ-class molecular chaperone
MFRSFTISLISALIFFGCETSDNNSVETKVKNEPPKYDLSTPDKTVKSILAYNTWYDTTETLLLKDLYSQQSKNYYSIFSKDAIDSLSKHRQEYFSEKIKNASKKYKIDNVDIQSDSRAIVLVKTEEMTFGWDHDKTLIMMKYTLSKDTDKWIIEDIESTCYSCDGAGTRKSYKSIYSTTYEKCDVCGGDGWISSIFKTQ